MVAPWDIYAERLFPLGYGHPLWIPEPSLSFGEIRIGDVGYISEGRFIFLFSSLRPAGDPVNMRGTPDEFELFTSEPSSLVEHPNEITQHEVRSQGVHSLSLEGSGAISIASSSVESGFRYMCTEHSGALLMLKHPAHSTRLTCSVRIREYMRRHLANWRAFATDTLGIDLQESDLIFVSGTVKTVMWAEAAFSSKTSHGELHISGDVFASPISGTFSASLSKCEQPTVFHRRGPLERTDAAQTDAHRGLATHEFDQCVFVNYFRMKSRLFRPRIMRAAAGPHGYTEGPSDDQSSYGLQLVAHTPEESSSSKVADPTERVLDYVLEYSTASVACATDQDATNYLRHQRHSTMDTDIGTDPRCPPNPAVVQVAPDICILRWDPPEDTPDSSLHQPPEQQLIKESSLPFSPSTQSNSYPSTGGVLSLNNYLQAQGILSHLEWADDVLGPRNAVTWSVTCLIDGVERGRGVAPSRSVARNIAAAQALQYLQGQSSKNTKSSLIGYNRVRDEQYMGFGS